MATQAKTDDFPDFTEPWEHSDALLVVEEDIFHVHRSILGMWSPVFSRMFTAEFKEKTYGQVELPGKKASEIKEMLLVIYPNSSKQIKESNYMFLLDLADEYMMRNLTKKCEDYLIKILEEKKCEDYLIKILEDAKPHSKIDEENTCLQLLDTAQRYSLERLQTACTDKAQGMSFLKLTNDKMYEKISLPNYRKIVEGKIKEVERKLDAKTNEVSWLQREFNGKEQEHERKAREHERGVQELKSHASNALRKFENIVYILEYISPAKSPISHSKTHGSPYTYGYHQEDPVDKKLVKIKNSKGELQKLYDPLKALSGELKALQR